MAVEVKGLTLLEATHNLYVAKNIHNSGSLYSSEVFFLKATTGEIVEKKDAVFLNTDGKIYKTNPSSLSSSMIVGFSEIDAAENSQIFIYSCFGSIIKNFENLSTGSRYFLSESAGKISTQAPKNKGTLVCQVGIAKSINELIIIPQLLVIN